MRNPIRSDRLRQAEADPQARALRYLDDLGQDLRAQARAGVARDLPLAGPAEAAALAAALHRCADRTLPKVEALLPREGPAACGPGCAWCCHQHTAVSVPEVLHLVAHLEQTLSPADLAALRAHVAAQAAQIRGTTIHRRWRLQIACGLLGSDGRCRAYAARPLLCRGCTSDNATHCAPRPGDALGIQAVLRYVPQGRLYACIAEGARDALGAAGLSAARLELTLGLDLALSDPEAGAKWLRGERVFAAAVLSEGEVPRAGLRPPAPPAPPPPSSSIPTEGRHG